jgi:hypothetical protein
MLLIFRRRDNLSTSSHFFLKHLLNFFGSSSTGLNDDLDLATICLIHHQRRLKLIPSTPTKIDRINTDYN